MNNFFVAAVKNFSPNPWKEGYAQGYMAGAAAAKELFLKEVENMDWLMKDIVLPEVALMKTKTENVCNTVESQLKNILSGME